MSSGTQLWILLLVYVTCASSAIPTLPGITDGKKQLEIHVTSSITRNYPDKSVSYTMFSREYVDEMQDKTRIVTYNNSIEVDLYVDFVTKQGFKVTRSNLESARDFMADCETSNITERGQSFGVKIGNGQLHVISVSNLVGWIDEYNPTLQADNVTVRGIPCSKYIGNGSRSANGQLQESYSLEYYLSKNYSMPYFPSSAQVPVRVVLRGNNILRGYNFTHIYDYTLFIPFVNNDPGFFNTPAGVFCEGRLKRPGAKIEQFQQWAEREEQMNLVDSNFTTRSIYYDRSMGLTRQDVYENDMNGHPTAVSVIHDFNTSLTYKRYLDFENCSVHYTSKNEPMLERWDVTFSGEISQMRNLSEFYDNLHYHGQRTVRGFLVDVWSMKNSTGDHVTVTELYISSLGSDGNMQGLKENRPIGFYIVRWHKLLYTVQREVIMNSFGTKLGPQDFDDFHAEECFSRSNSRRKRLILIFMDQAKQFGSGRVGYNELSREMRKWLAAASSVSPLRVTDILIFAGESAQEIEVFFTLHAPVRPIEDLTDVSQTAADELSVTQAEAYITASMTGGNLIMRFTGRDGYTKVFNPIKIVKDIGKEADAFASTTPSYSPGAMAGLGIGMLLLGAILTVVAGGIVWYKRFDINLPYTRSTD